MYKIIESKPKQFQPIILYNDHQLFDIPMEQKEKIHDMLKFNGQLWTSLSSTTSPLLSPTLSSTSSTSSTSSSTLLFHHSKLITNTTTPPPSSPEYQSHDEDNNNNNNNNNTISFQSKKKPSSSSLKRKNNHQKKKIMKKKKNHSINNDEEEEEELELEQKKRGNLPKSIIFILKQWLINHSDHPYPSDEEKAFLQKETNLTINQISNWFINARRRLLPYLTNDNIIKKKKHQDIKHIQKKSISTLKRPKRSCNNK
ncbi:unnamed protein product [Cunninghamella echinulata]